MKAGRSRGETKDLGEAPLPGLLAGAAAASPSAGRAADLAAVVRQVPSVRAVVLLALVMVVALALSATALLVDLRQKELAHARGETSSLTRVLAEQTTRTFEGVVLTLQSARERLSDERGQALTLDHPLITLLLQARSSGLPQVKSIFLADRDGINVNSSRSDFIRGLSLREREFFRHFADRGGEEVFISRPEVARIDGEWTFYVGVRLQDAAGQFRGVLVAAISIEYFEALYASIGVDFVRRVQLLDRQGVVLAGRPHDDVVVGKTIAGAELRRRLALLPASAVSEETEEVGDEAGGGRRYVAYRPVAKYPLLVSASIDEDDALARWHRLMRPLVAGVAVVLLLVLATTFSVIKNLLRKAALESELKASDERLRHLVQSVQDAIVTVDAAGRVVLFNGAAEYMFDVAAGQAIGSPLDDLLARSLRPPQAALVQAYLADAAGSAAAPAPLGIIDLVTGRREFPVELRVSTSRFRGETLLTVVFRDLTESQRVELELLETNRQLKDVSASLQTVREDAKARIARELHDELGQLLTGIRMEVAWIGGRLLPQQQVLVDKVRSVKGQIDQTIASVRRIASELRPLVLDDLGFAAAAGWYVDQFSARTGLPVDLVLPGEDPARGDAVATALFRILQESLTNVARHAQARRVEVRVARSGALWTLRVGDDGVGFVEGSGKPGHMGLVGMRERAQILGGSLSVTTAPGAGTVIEASIPAEKS